MPSPGWVNSTKRPGLQASRMPEYKNPQSEPGMEQRFLLVFLLMAVVIFGSQLLIRKYMPQQPPSSAHPTQPAQPAPAQSSSSSSSSSPVPFAPEISKPRAAESAASKVASSEAQTVIENDLYRITFTN